MKLLVTGAHGRTGRHIVSLLGDRAKALVRSEDQVAGMMDLGAEAVVGDLTDTSLDGLLSGCSGVIFAAGAGMDGDPEQVDNAGAIKLIEALQRSGGERFVMVSSMGTTYPDKMPPMLKPYLVAKRKAEEVLETSGLTYTIVRPGGLTDVPGTGHVDIAPALNRGGSVPREDVAEVVVAGRRPEHDLQHGVRPPVGRYDHRRGARQPDERLNRRKLYACSAKTSSTATRATSSCRVWARRGSASS